MNSVYRDVRAVDGLRCTVDGRFTYKGKRKKVIYAKRNFGNEKATARIFYKEGNKVGYIQASKAVAMAWKPGYDETKHYITYKDGDIHNIHADNLVLGSYDDFVSYRMRNCGHTAAPIEIRIKKLQLVIDEASMTKHFFETLDFEPINKHVTDYLYICLITYCKETLHLGETVALDIVPECIARMYECIMNGMCLYNYERYCKKLLLNYKKKRNFGFTGCVPKPIDIKVQHLNLDCLWERYKKSTRK